MTKLYKVLTVRVAQYLQTLGFKLVDVQPDLYKPKYNTFLFEDSPELQEAIRNMPPKEPHHIKLDEVVEPSPDEDPTI